MNKYLDFGAFGKYKFFVVVVDDEIDQIRSIATCEGFITSIIIEMLLHCIGFNCILFHNNSIKLQGYTNHMVTDNLINAPRKDMCISCPNVFVHTLIKWSPIELKLMA